MEISALSVSALPDLDPVHIIPADFENDTKLLRLPIVRHRNFVP